jgi:MFS family permease
MPDRLLTRSFVLVSLANLFNGLSFNLYLHLPGFLKDLGADEVQIGFIVGSAAIAAIAVRPPIGAAMDIRGRKPVIIGGNILNIASVLLYLTVTQLGPWVYVVRVLHGISEAILFTALFTYGADIVPKSRLTEGLALFGTSGLLPIALGGLLGDFVLSVGSFDALFLTALGFSVASLAVSLPLEEPELDREPGEHRAGFLSSVRQRDLRPLWWMTGVFALVLTGYFTFLKTFVDETGFGSVGLFFSAYIAMAIGVRLAFAWLPDRVGPKRVLFPSMACLVLGFVVLAGAGGSAEVVLAGLLCGIGHGFGFPILYGFVVRRARVSDRGTAVSIFTSLFDVGTLIGGPILGAIIVTSGYEDMFLAAAAMLVFGTAIYAWWDRASGRRPPSILERPVPAHHQ